MVLQQPQEDTHHGVALDVVVYPALQEHIGFVQEQHCVPRLADLQHALQLGLDRFAGNAKFSHVDALQRFVQGLSHRFGRHRFANARRSVQEEDQAAALSGNDVIHEDAFALVDH